MPNKLGSLKLRDMRSPRRVDQGATIEAPERPEYPYGLRLSLDENALTKLDVGLPEVGQTFFVVALARVRGVSEFRNEDETTQNVDLQIERLSLDQEFEVS